MTLRPFLMTVSLLAAASTASWAQGDPPTGPKVYEKVVDSIVGIRCKAPLGERSGSGIIITKEGLILASYSVVPEGSENIRVWLHGPRLLVAEIVATSKANELTLLQVKPKGDLKPIEFGDSDSVKLGDVSYTIGNASNSIIDNDSASFSAGVISAKYRLDEPRANSTYIGPVLESTAAVNPRIEGAPMLDAHGKMVGFVTLNYSPNRFLGAAIPASLLLPVIERLKAGAKTTPIDDKTDEAEGYLGIQVGDEKGAVVITAVDKGSPAEAQGLVKGIVILAVGSGAVKTAKDFNLAMKDLKAGTTLFLKIREDGVESVQKIVVEKKGK